MAVRADQLSAHLPRSLAPVYLLAGAEPLLVQECRDRVFRAAQEQGFTERTVHDVNAKFDWGRLTDDSAALSLFSSRKIIDVLNRLVNYLARMRCWDLSRWHWRPLRY